MRPLIVTSAFLLAEVRPTIAGMRAGRDEVLEAAVKRALGRAITPAELAALAAPLEKPTP